MDKLAIFITSSSMIDGETPLENWMPFGIRNQGEIFLDTGTNEFGSGLHETDLVWKPGLGIADYKKLRLKFIQFKLIESYTWRAEKNLCEKD